MKRQNSTKKEYFSKENILIFLILILTLISYASAFDNDFTNWDDDNYVTYNPLVHNFSFQNIADIFIFKGFQMGNYHPLTILSLNIDYQLSPNNPAIFIAVNVIMHLLNTLLLFKLIYLISKNINISLITSLMFGITTLHVESVAWISERKDVLYTLFYLLALIKYVQYTYTGNKKLYLFSLMFFLLSLLSKGMAVALSLSLLAVDYFLGRKILSKKVILEKIPFFVLSIIFGLIAIKAQRPDMDFVIDLVPDYNFFERLLLGGYAFVMYVLKLIFPFKLSAYYPYPQNVNIIYLIHFLFFISVIVVSIIFWKRNKYISFAIIFFIINIILVLQFLPVGNAVMADRYSYVPSIGLFFIMGYFYDKIKFRLKQYVLFTYIFVIMVLTFQRANIWQDSKTLWTDVIAKYENAQIAYNNRGLILHEEGNFVDAIKDFEKAIEVSPNYVFAYNNIGKLKSEQSKHQEAIKYFSKAIEINKNYSNAYSNLAMSFVDIKKYQKALKYIDTAISKQNDMPLFYLNRGLIYKDLKKYDLAIENFTKATELDPKYAQAYTNRGYIKQITNRIQEAEEDYNLAIKADPTYGNAYFNRGTIKIKQARIDACKDFRKALELGYKEADEVVRKYCQ